MTLGKLLNIFKPQVPQCKVGIMWSQTAIGRILYACRHAWYSVNVLPGIAGGWEVLVFHLGLHLGEGAGIWNVPFVPAHSHSSPPHIQSYHKILCIPS